MKEYLNKQERLKVEAVVAGAGVAMELLGESRQNMSQEEIDCLTQISQISEQYLRHLFQRVGVQEANRIVKDIKTHTLKLEPTDKAQREYAAIRNQVTLRRQEFNDWSEAVLDVRCHKCNRQGEELDKCRLRAIFHENDLPKFDESPGENCQYRIVKGE